MSLFDADSVECGGGVAATLCFARTQSYDGSGVSVWREKLFVDYNRQVKRLVTEEVECTVVSWVLIAADSRKKIYWKPENGIFVTQMGYVKTRIDM